VGIALMMNGIGLESIHKLLGHASIETTMVYAHLTKGHLRIAVDKLPTLLGDESTLAPKGDETVGK